MHAEIYTVLLDDAAVVVPATRQECMPHTHRSPPCTKDRHHVDRDLRQVHDTTQHSAQL